MELLTLKLARTPASRISTCLHRGAYVPVFRIPIPAFFGYAGPDPGSKTQVEGEISSKLLYTIQILNTISDSTLICRYLEIT